MESNILNPTAKRTLVDELQNIELYINSTYFSCSSFIGNMNGFKNFKTTMNLEFNIDL